MKKRDDGFLRYEIKLIRQDGSAKILDREATAHRCNVLCNRIKKNNKLGFDAKLQFRVSKLV